MLVNADAFVQIVQNLDVLLCTLHNLKYSFRRNFLLMAIN